MAIQTCNMCVNFKACSLRDIVWTLLARQLTYVELRPDYLFSAYELMKVDLWANGAGAYAPNTPLLPIVLLDIPAPLAHNMGQMLKYVIAIHT